MRYLIIMLTSAKLTKESIKSGKIWVILAWLFVLSLFIIGAILLGVA